MSYESRTIRDAVYTYPQKLDHELRWNMLKSSQLVEAKIGKKTTTA